MSLLFVLLVGTICSMTTKSKLSPFEENLLPQHSIMKRLNNIFVQLKDISDTDNSSNVKTYNAFVEVIQGLIDDLERDTQKHFEVLVEMSEKCSAEDEFRDNEVANANAAINNAESSRNVCQQHLDKAQSLLVEAQNLLDAEEQKKKERTEIREREHAQYLNEKEQYDETLAFLSEFTKMVSEKFAEQSSISFIQFSENLLRHTSKIGKVGASVPVLVMLSQYVSGSNGTYTNVNGAESSKTLVEKLNGLTAIIQKDLDDIIALENQRQSDYDAFLSKVNQNIDELKASIEQLKAQVQENQECVARESAIITEASAKSNRNSDLKDKAIKMCAKFVEEVEEAQAARRTEVDVVRQILNLMNVRFGKVPKRMSDYLDSVENQFAEYENKTQLIAYKVYKYQALNENALGKDITADNQSYDENKKF